MTIPPIIAVLIAILLLGLVTLTALAAVFVLARALRATHGGESIPGHAPQLVLFAFVLGLIAAAIFGIGRAYDVLVEGWPALLGIVGTLFGGWLGYRAATKIATSRGGTVDVGPPTGAP